MSVVQFHLLPPQYKFRFFKCLNAFDFHHIENKKHNASYVIHRWSWIRAKKELEKCILLCANCHREIHATNIDSSLLRLVKPFITKTCKVCNKLYDTKENDSVYCSWACLHIGQHKVKHPTKKELQLLIDSGVSWLQLGRMFKVSDNAVRKWARRMGCKL